MRRSSLELDLWLQSHFGVVGLEAVWVHVRRFGGHMQWKVKPQPRGVGCTLIMTFSPILVLCTYRPRRKIRDIGVVVVVVFISSFFSLHLRKPTCGLWCELIFLYTTNARHLMLMLTAQMCKSCKYAKMYVHIHTVHIHIHIHIHTVWVPQGSISGPVLF